MKAPELPTNEAERLAALRSYDVLDTEAEASFDALAKLAAVILDVPIALVSLIDSDRQWFKARHGLEATATPREVSFCGHVVASEAPLVVFDAFADPRFADNPLTIGEPRVRFYAGHPLRTPDGFVLGTLCAIGHLPKQPTPTQLEMLALLAGQVVDQLEARRKRHLLVRKRAAALENTRRLDALFEAMAEGVVVQDREGAITIANASAERILGLTLDQMAGRTSTDPRWRSVRADGSPFPGADHPALVTMRTGTPSVNVIMGVHKPSGELTWISINSVPLRDDPGAQAHAVVTTFHDITLLRAAQADAERLSRQEHLVTTGTLAAGVGHEINNPLTFIIANLEYSLEELRAIAGGSPSRRLSELIEVLGEAREGAERVSKIVRGLRALAREEAEPIPTNVEPTIELSINMAAHESRHKATVVRHIAQTPPVLADESRITQVLVNLLVNAAQAFPTGDVEHNRITVTSALEPDGRVSIAVSDNGPGIPPELQRRIFDPFFTTKSIGQGTGLGLSISQSIVRALAGELILESTVGEGSTFRVLLPVAKRPLGSDTPPKIDTGARGRVLVIDDEASILSVMGRILGKEHDVVALSDARQALKLLQGGERFDVVFCDLMMPHLGGEELHRRVQAISPALAEIFVFITGGATETGLQDFLARVPNERIDKPFSAQTLRGVVRRFVEAGSASR